MNPGYNIAADPAFSGTGGVALRNLTWMALVLLSLSPALWARKEESLDRLKQQADAAHGAERVNLCLEIASRQLSAANQLYTDGKAEDARAAVQDVASYSEMAGAAAGESGKKIKHAEISVRKMSRKLADLKRTLNFEDQQPVQDAVDRLEAVRTHLLTRMFGGKKQ
jgi:hypothetical protein